MVTEANRQFALRQTLRLFGYATAMCGLGGLALTSFAAYKLDVKSVRARRLEGSFLNSFAAFRFPSSHKRCARLCPAWPSVLQSQR